MGDGLTLEKLKIDERLRAVEAHMAEAKPFRDNLTASIERLEKTVASINSKIEPIEDLKKAEESRRRSQEVMMKSAVGVITLAIGTAVLWVCKVIITAFKNL